jgi:hypothetical protein
MPRNIELIANLLRKLGDNKSFLCGFEERDVYVSRASSAGGIKGQGLICDVDVILNPRIIMPVICDSVSVK